MKKWIALLLLLMIPLTLYAETKILRRGMSTAGFADIQTGTNTTATMTVGTGATLDRSGTGIIDANRFAGVTTVDQTEFAALNGTTLGLLSTLSPTGQTDYILGVNATADGFELKSSIAVDTVNLSAVTKYQVLGTTLGEFTETLLRKTYDASSTGNVLKQYKSFIITHPCVFGSATAQQTTVTSRLYGNALFADDVAANNYIEYECIVPRNMDTSVDPVGYFKFRLVNADTAIHEYSAEVISIADSSSAETAVGTTINLTWAADANGAQHDVETASGTLTGWGAAMTPGQLCYIRITRDGASDASTVDSYSVCFELYYKESQ